MYDPLSCATTGSAQCSCILPSQVMLDGCTSTAYILHGGSEDALSWLLLPRLNSSHHLLRAAHGPSARNMRVGFWEVKGAAERHGEQLGRCCAEGLADPRRRAAADESRHGHVEEVVQKRLHGLGRPLGRQLLPLVFACDSIHISVRQCRGASV